MAYETQVFVLHHMERHFKQKKEGRHDGVAGERCCGYSARLSFTGVTARHNEAFSSAEERELSLLHTSSEEQKRGRDCKTNLYLNN